MTVDEAVELLARRGALGVVSALEGPALAPRSLEHRLAPLAAPVVAQRVAELAAAGVVETVPESGELRLSARGRRLQGLLDQLARWADGR